MTAQTTLKMGLFRDKGWWFFVLKQEDKTSTNSIMKPTVYNDFAFCWWQNVYANDTIMTHKCVIMSSYHHQTIKAFQLNPNFTLIHYKSVGVSTIIFLPLINVPINCGLCHGGLTDCQLQKWWQSIFFEERKQFQEPIFWHISRHWWMDQVRGLGRSANGSLQSFIFFPLIEIWPVPKRQKKHRSGELEDTDTSERIHTAAAGNNNFTLHHCPNRYRLPASNGHFLNTFNSEPHGLASTVSRESSLFTLISSHPIDDRG